MPLLDVPPEIFERISYFLVSSIDLEDVFQYRTLCRTFSQYITVEMCEKLSRTPPDDMLLLAAHRKIFHTYGTRILTKRVMRGDHEDNPLLKIAQDCVESALSQGLGTGEDKGTRRLECTLVVCNLLSTLEHSSLMRYLGSTSRVRKSVIISKISDTVPAIAAALNNTKWLVKHITTISNVLSSACEVLPCALDTAVMFQSRKALYFILRGLLKSIEDVGVSEASDRTSRIGLGVSNALRLAIRLHKTNEAEIIFYFAIGYKEFYLSTWKYLADDLIDFCVEQDQLALIDHAFHYRYGYFAPSKAYIARALLRSTEEYEHLFKSGHLKRFEFLLEHKIVDPNFHDPKFFPRTDITPLMLALRHRRHDIARCLLQNGADINAKSSRGRGETALMFAAKHGFYEDIRFLLCNGADNNELQEAIRLSKLYEWRKCTWLLEKVAKKGVDYVRSEDIWEEYGSERCILSWGF